MERLFKSFDRYITEQLEGAILSEEQELVLAYLIKSEWANEQLGYTILLTPDNNHYTALRRLEQVGLISKHALSTAAYPIYIADRALVQRTYTRELRELFGDAFDQLDEMAKAALGVVYRHNQFSNIRHVSAKQTAFALWYEQGGVEKNIKEFDVFYRKLRKLFNKVERDGFVEKMDETRGYVLRGDFLETHLVENP